ncbi:MAG: CRTAC1 family protein [Planctomycetota bacterium]
MHRVRLCSAPFLVLAAAFGSAAPASAQLFRDVSDRAGFVDLRQQVPREFGDCLLGGGRFCETERLTGGIAVGDYDADGWPDIYLTALDPPGRLMRNRGDGTFEDVTFEVGLALGARGNGAAWVDVDKDGDLDLYVSTVAQDRFHLYVQVNGRFAEDGRGRGLDVEADDPRSGFSIAVGDYDGDGWPDLHTTEWRLDAIVENGSASANRLFRNRGAVEPGHFDDRTRFAGVDLDRVSPDGTFAFASAFEDLDDDGVVDLLVASDFGTSRLFWGNGDGTFTDTTEESGVGTDENGMGSTLGDFDGDGDLDWFVTSVYDPDDRCAVGGCNWGATGNRLYRNDGDRRFTDVTDAAGVRDGRWGWGAAFFDADLDGDLDLAMTNGVDFVGRSDAPFNEDAARYWRNDGPEAEPRFVEQAEAARFVDRTPGKGMALIDYDRDGDLDVVMARTLLSPRIWRNDAPPEHAWLVVKAVGTESTRESHGARVRLRPRDGGPAKIRRIDGPTHFLGQSEMGAWFGLGPSEEAVDLEVRWPSGATVSFECVAPRQHIEAVEPVGGAALRQPPPDEVCNGRDDDCDGETDEAPCEPLPDAGPPDAAPDPDASDPDASDPDASDPEVGPPDAGADAGPNDAGPPDSGPGDGPPVDDPPVDGATLDAAPDDASADSARGAPRVDAAEPRSDRTDADSAAGGDAATGRDAATDDGERRSGGTGCATHGAPQPVLTALWLLALVTLRRRLALARWDLR